MENDIDNEINGKVYIIRNITKHHFSLGYPGTFSTLSKSMIGGRVTRLSNTKKSIEVTSTFTIETATGNMVTIGDVSVKGSTTLGDSYDTDTISFNGMISNPIPFMFDGNPGNDFTTKLEIADQTSNIELVLPSTNGTILTTGNVMDEISGKTINCRGVDEIDTN